MEEKNLNPISEKIITESKNYVFPIKIQDKIGSCFFINILKTLYLCINYDLLTEEFIKSKGVISINENIQIKLDEKTRIIPFKNQCKFILIENSNDIPPNYKLNLETDLNPDQYINRDAYLFAFNNTTDNNLENKGGYIPGKILDIKEYKILHQFNTKNLLTVAPICCLFNDTVSNQKLIKVIGIQLEDPDTKGYKSVSFGYLLRYVLSETNIEFGDKKENEHNLLKSDKFLKEIVESENYSFYTLQQYRESIKDLHIKISSYYMHQTLQNYNTKYKIINDGEYRRYLKNLYLFKNINIYQESIFNSIDIVKNLNKILLSNDFNLIGKFSYFISGFMYVLNKYSKDYVCQFKNDGDLLYSRAKLSLKELEYLDEISTKVKNEDKIITFKTFLFNVASLEHFHGKMCALLLDIENYFSFFNTDKFDTKIFIEHHFQKGWQTSCFSTKTYNYKTFNLFTFFKVNEVKINFEEKYAEIKLEVVGKNEIFEEKFNIKGKDYFDYTVDYIENENLIKIYDSNRN